MYLLSVIFFIAKSSSFAVAVPWDNGVNELSDFSPCFVEIHLPARSLHPRFPHEMFHPGTSRCHFGYVDCRIFTCKAIFSGENTATILQMN